MGKCQGVVCCPLRWRHNGHDSVSNHQHHHCLLNSLFGRRSKKTSKLRVTGLCAVNSPGTGEFPAQMASNAENVSIWWRHRGSAQSWGLLQYRTSTRISSSNLLIIFKSSEASFVQDIISIAKSFWKIAPRMTVILSCCLHNFETIWQPINKLCNHISSYDALWDISIWRMGNVVALHYITNCTCCKIGMICHQ